MKILKGDIVEVISAKYQNWSEIPDHEKGYFIQQKEYPIIRGFRFRVDGISNRDNQTSIWTIINGKHQSSVSVDCVMIYKRPFKNYIKSILQDFKTYFKS